MEDLVVEPKTMSRLGLFWPLVLPAVGWLALVLLRSILPPKTSAFSWPFQTALGWLVVAVASVYGAVILVISGWVVRFVPL